MEEIESIDEVELQKQRIEEIKARGRYLTFECIIETGLLRRNESPIVLTGGKNFTSEELGFLTVCLEQVKEQILEQDEHARDIYEIVSSHTSIVTTPISRKRKIKKEGE